LYIYYKKWSFDMKKVKINNTDLNVSQISYGTANIGTKRDKKEEFAMLDAFIDAGGNFIDTARIYSDWVPGEIGRSERILGEWFKARNYPKDIVMATKGAHPMLDSMEKPRMDKADVEYDIKQSLAALGVETIDLYYLHRDAKEVSVEYIIDFLEDFRRAGYLRYYACSNWEPARIAAAQKYAKEKGYVGFVANEMLWSMATAHMPAPEDGTLVRMNEEMYELHESTGLCAVPYSSQAGGYFTKILETPENAKSSSYHCKENEKRAKEMAEMFADAKTPMQYVLGYFTNRPFQVIPAFSVSSMEQLKDTILAAEHPLDPKIRL
jgi:aryl-alcohol dehydrogenase-like predicted oxidoreductase